MLVKTGTGLQQPESGGGIHIICACHLAYPAR
jgi:hypothetical protein